LETFPNKSERTGSKGYNELVVPALMGDYQVPLEGAQKGTEGGYRHSKWKYSDVIKSAMYT
jgi:hypothetical protein